MNTISYISNSLITSIREEGGKEEQEELQPALPDEKPFWFVLLFLPRLLLVKPLLFSWYLLTFPLTLFEQNNSNNGRSRDSQTANSLSDASSIANNNAFYVTKGRKRTEQLQNLDSVLEDDMKGGEMILQRDTVKGSLLNASNLYKVPGAAGSGKNNSAVKSMSSSVAFGTKKMGRFLFPKKLIPRSILHSGRKKKLVLDLDETLIHSISRSNSNSNNAQAHLVEVKFQISGISTLYYVHKRPYCDLFLSNVSKWYDLIIFTASMKEYADPVIDWLESSFVGNFSKRYYRNHCILRDGVGYIKDLSIINDTNDDHGNELVRANSILHEIILIDNSPVSYAMNVDNAIQVEGWISDPTDQDLLNLLPFLESLRYTTDVRNILSLKNGERAFDIN
ncbi:hypothetical protein TPHA_0G03500 [Tetrapisispora phaffii CBS 4417]|uniref:FCP1 homology domain-containing protein n=1 Tax=Tetrapisispora phaffii (strain ATCC 24235 / CBS 4417 / NBRC 1672 / NRRL Y-8282 / UCD 70-5) TaxID=1071381 RepID=G8BWB2_TETPH|nr:hypothetical protein TPHA_0G03500 [Tetrapisispora phaffii CBS 4417]CCE64190.1 hypothetical protein TPHA_0G03500 [Tetrapisispora phaffii CBS 4417]